MKKILKKIPTFFIVLSFILNTVNLKTVKADTLFKTFPLQDEFLDVEAEHVLISNERYKELRHNEASNKIILRSDKDYKDENDVFNREDDIRFNIDVKSEGFYTIWVRAYYADYKEGELSSGNYFVRVDSKRNMMHYDNNKLFSWNSCNTYKFEKGIHEIGIQPRRSNVGIDKIIITSNEFYVPKDMGEKPLPFKLGDSYLKDVYYKTPSYIPVNEHPRLFLRKNEIGKIKADLLNPHPENKKAWEEVKNNAKKDIDCVKYAKGTHGYNANIHPFIESMAFLYAVDKEDYFPYGRKAIDKLKDYLSNIDYSKSGLYTSRSGIIQLLSKVYDWCYDLLEDEEKIFLIKYSLRLANKLECGWPPIKLSAFNSDHGGEGSIQVDMLSLGLVTYEDFPDIWYTAGGRFFSEFIPINNFYYNSSSWRGEGDSYGKERYGYEAKANAILYKLGLSHLISENEHYIGYNQILRRRPDGNLMMDGDIWDKTFNNYAGNPGSLLYLSSRYKDPYLKYELFKMCENGLERGIIDSKMTVCEFLILNDTSVPLKSNEDLPLTMYTGEGHNMMTARTSYEDGIESNSMIVSIKGGGRTKGSHMHLDAGNFMIYYKGPLALDSGIYNGLSYLDENGKLITDTQSGSYHNKNYQKRTVAHNCVLVYDKNEDFGNDNKGNKLLNDGGQISGRYNNKKYNTYKDATGEDKIIAKKLGVDYGPYMNKPSYSYLKTDLTNAYSAKVKGYERTFMFLNFFDDIYPGALVVLDRVESSSETFKKSWLLHSQEEPLIKDNITTIKRTDFGYNGRLINETLLPKKDNLSISKVGGEGKEYTVDGKNIKAVTSVKGDESGKWRIEVTPKTENKTDYFLNVMQVSSNDSSIKPLKSTMYENEKYIGIKIKDRVLYLSKEKARTSLPVEIYADGNEIMEYMVDGLECGKWNVTDSDGNTVTSGSVTDEGGVLYFKLKGGSYTLKKDLSVNNFYKKDFNILNNLSNFNNPVSYKISYNNIYSYIDKSEPVINKNDMIYIPFKRVAKIIGDNSLYKIENNKIYFKLNDTSYEFDLMSNSCKINNNTIYLTNSFIKENNIVYMPYTVLKEAFDKNVRIDPIGKILWVNDISKSTYDTIVNINRNDRVNIKNVNNMETAKTADGNPATYYDDFNSELIYEFKDEVYLNKVSLQFADSFDKHYKFDFYVSTDNINYNLLDSNVTSSASSFIDYTYPATKAKFFKIKGYGNDKDSKFNLKEVKFFKENKKDVTYDIAYRDTDGNYKNEIKDTVVIDFNIKNNNTFDINKNYVFITGLYKDDMLYKAYMNKGVLHFNSNNEKQIINVPSDGNYKVKSFLWDNSKNIMPITDPIKVKLNINDWLSIDDYMYFSDAGVTTYTVFPE